MRKGGLRYESFDIPYDMGTKEFIRFILQKAYRWNESKIATFEEDYGELSFDALCEFSQKKKVKDGGIFIKEIIIESRLDGCYCLPICSFD